MVVVQRPFLSPTADWVTLGVRTICWRFGRFLFSRPSSVWVKIHIESCCEHLGGELFGVISGLVLGFAEAVVL